MSNSFLKKIKGILKEDLGKKVKFGKIKKILEGSSGSHDDKREIKMILEIKGMSPERVKQVLQMVDAYWAEQMDTISGSFGSVYEVMRVFIGYAEEKTVRSVEELNELFDERRDLSSSAFDGVSPKQYFVNSGLWERTGIDFGGIEYSGDEPFSLDTYRSGYRQGMSTQEASYIEEHLQEDKAMNLSQQLSVLKTLLEIHPYGIKYITGYIYGVIDAIGVVYERCREFFGEYVDASDADRYQMYENIERIIESEGCTTQGLYEEIQGVMQLQDSFSLLDASFAGLTDEEQEDLGFLEEYMTLLINLKRSYEFKEQKQWIDSATIDDFFDVFRRSVKDFSEDEYWNDVQQLGFMGSILEKWSREERILVEDDHEQDDLLGTVAISFREKLPEDNTYIRGEQIEMLTEDFQHYGKPQQEQKLLTELNSLLTTLRIQPNAADFYSFSSKEYNRDEYVATLGRNDLYHPCYRLAQEFLSLMKPEQDSE